jgi:uncharacterized CHY-type Zn-finger protein
MSEVTSAIPQKVLVCREEGHHVIEFKRGATLYYACEHCHYVLEAHCIEKESMVLSRT